MERMTGIFVICILLLGNVAVGLEVTHESYNETRNRLIKAESRLATGGRIHLNEEELKFDEIFLRYKQEELARGLEQQEINAPAMHFFKAKPLIEQSKIFQILQRMPKGANLHVHDLACVSSKWVVENLLAMNNLLRCVNNNGVNILTFRQSNDHNCATKYWNVTEERLSANSTENFDRNFEAMFNLWTPYPEIKYRTLDSVWTDFRNIFLTISDVLNYLPFYRAYYYQFLKELYNDNIIYSELRMGINRQLYDEYGNIYAPERTVQELINVVEDFKKEHHGFIGVKAISVASRKSTDEIIRQDIELFNYLHKLFPSFIIGFDVVGEEDKGRTLYSILSVLSEFPLTTKFFFHAGETNLYGSSSDLNLLDALLINTTRIGHGFALTKHPILADQVKKRKIAIEVSLISNQVLNLLSDLRNHPASIFVSRNIPFVICNDDPGYWNAQGVSYDFYYAIMSIAPNYGGLRTLKALVWNSIEYSVLTDMEREQGFDILNQQWNKFIDEALINEQRKN